MAVYKKLKGIANDVVAFDACGLPDTVGSIIEMQHAGDCASPTAKMEGGLRVKEGRGGGKSGQLLITIITSTYNAAEHLTNTINSIREQTYSNIEWIVVDGASKDGTLDILRQNEDVIDYWVSEPDKGIYDAWNKGLRLARGEWICFVGADDRLLPGAIEAMVNVANESPAPLDLISGKVQLYSGTVPRRIIGRPWAWCQFRKYMCVAHVGAIHSAAYFKRYGDFDSNYRIAGDYELLLRAGSNLKAGFVNQVLAFMEIGGVSNQNAAVFREAFRARLKHGASSRFAGVAGPAWAWLKWKLRRLINC